MYIPLIVPSHEATQVLDSFRGRFIDEMDANSVVHELFHNKIIRSGDLKKITTTLDEKEQNSFLYLYLKKCTDEVFKEACEIIIKHGKDGRSKMKALGEDMLKAMSDAKMHSLVTGVCAPTYKCIGLYACVCITRNTCCSCPKE